MSGPASARPEGLRIGIDIGGTFTDVAVAEPDGGVEIYKTPSTPRDPLRGLLEA